MQQIKNLVQNKKAPKLGRLLICNNLMVREIDVRWNTLQISISSMYQKLRELGFRQCDGQIIILDRQKDGNG